MLQKAEESGELKPGQTVIETTSGNTGIALAAFCAATNHPLIIYMEPGCTPERSQIMKAYGADLRGIMEIPNAETILKEHGLNPVILMQAVKAFAEENDFYYVAQLFNENNPGAHYNTTAPELVEDTDGKIDIAVMLAGIAYETAREVAKSDGVFLGASAASVITVAKELAQRPENEGKNIVAILADNGMKYLSTDMYK